MKTLKDRQKLARKFKNSSHNKCKCCNMPSSLTKMKAICFEKKISSSSFTVPLCLLCFNDPNIDFVTIFNLYTKRSVYQHEDFTDNQIETIIESLIEELRNNSILQVKYRQYLQSSREEKLEILFGK